MPSMSVIAINLLQKLLCLGFDKINVDDRFSLMQAFLTKMDKKNAIQTMLFFGFEKPFCTQRIVWANLV